jgi:hypothetical protein
MNTVELVVVAAVMIAAGLLRAAVTDMFKQEFGTRLAGLPKQLIHIAARRLPAPIREEYLEDWLGELARLRQLAPCGAASTSAVARPGSLRRDPGARKSRAISDGPPNWQYLRMQPKPAWAYKS